MTTLANALAPLLQLLLLATSMNCAAALTSTRILTPCDLLDAIDDYVSHVASIPSLEDSFQHQKYYNPIATEFNGVLAKAQNNAISWRHGESTLDLLKKTYREAFVFGNEFNRKYGISQERLKTLSQPSHSQKFIQKLQADIRKFEEEIRDAERMLSLADLPSVKQYFESRIVSKRQEIEKKQKELSQNSNVSLQLQEIVLFLEFVGEDARSVEHLSGDSAARLVALSENFKSDLASFKNQVPMVSAGVKALAVEEESLKTNLTMNKAERQKLETEKAEFKELMNNLTEINVENLEKIHNMTDWISEKTDTFYSQKQRLCNDSGLFQSMLAANASLSAIEAKCNEVLLDNYVFFNLREEEFLFNMWKKENEDNREYISQLLEEVKGIDQKIGNLFTTETKSKTRLHQISLELASLHAHSTDLERLQHSINSTKDFLLAISRQFQGLHSSFEAFTRQLNDALARGKTAGSDQEKSAKLEMEKIISGIQTQLQQLLIPDLKRCS